MKKWTQYGKTLLFPPVWVLLLASLSFPALVWLFLNQLEASPVAYPLYVLSAYALTVDCLWLIPLLLRRRKQRKAAALEESLSPEEKLHKMKRGLYQDFLVSTGFGLFYLLSAYFESSVWVWANGIYNLVLGFSHLMLLRYQRRLEAHYDPRLAWKGYTRMGWWLVIVNLTMTGCVFLVVWRNEAKSYPGVMIFAIAAWTFYKLTAEIISLIHSRKNNSPILGASCNAKHTEALMSLFLLQTALLAAFGQDFPHQKLMNTLTGTGVCLLTVLGAVGMVLHGNKRRKELGTSHEQ